MKPMWSIAIHGGCGIIPKSISPELKQSYLNALRSILEEGITQLDQGRHAIDVVQKACEMLEDYPEFNAGRGSSLDENGKCVLEASIMKSNLECGAASGLEHVKNPIRLARAVMDHTRHHFLISHGAEKFAIKQGLEMVDNEYFVTEKRKQLWNESQNVQKPKGGGTIGCVARDIHGNMAAGTSTGGLLRKLEGRVGDSPIIGAGNYCNKFAAVSGTGVGEFYIRNCVSYQVCARMEFGGQSLEKATQEVISSLPLEIGGLIAVDHQNNVVMKFNTLGMNRACATSDGKYFVGIWENEEKDSDKE